MNHKKPRFPYRWQGKNLLLDLYIQSRSSKDTFGGQHGDRLKITITAPAVEGRANKHLVIFLANYCGVRQSHVEIARGDTSRYKSVLILEPKKHLDEFTKQP